MRRPHDHPATTDTRQQRKRRLLSYGSSSKHWVVTFRTQDVGKQGHIQRLAGKRPSGSWATVKWLISKEDAHVLGERLIPDTKGAKDVIKQIGSLPVHLRGDRFKAKEPSNGGKRSQPTAARQKARRENIKKTPARDKRR